MKTSVKAGWIVAILAATIIFSFIASGSDDWAKYKVLVQEEIYEYVPASQTQILARWLGTVAFSALIGIILGLVIYAKFEEEE